MKKLFLAAFAVFAFASVNAQEFKAGVNAGLPIGDAGDFSTFAIAVELGYLFEVSEDFQAGPTVGFNHSFGDSDIIDEDFSWLPIAAAGRFAVSEEFTLGADLGYAIGVAPDGIDSGFYYAPRVQYGVSDALDIVLAYRGISLDGISWSQITLGVEFGL
ncbi:outer membrane beta-barrel protein [Winogradskyella sp.]|uniref:outer membrane beta-barrel protein n=1 Tax=Winogradskyella sp. TaxID=1883156 RepID=UPI001B206FF5|nr:outer membrane beta-barrel protein [Winogradskyella sp.]MBO6880973.1 outer membrane beta-barrel protein [Winogradskyella sp.]